MPEESLQVGQQVWWNDPDDGLCSGFFRVSDVRDDIVFLKSEAGSEAEAFTHEIGSPEDEVVENLFRDHLSDTGRHITADGAVRLMAASGIDQEQSLRVFQCLVDEAYLAPIPGTDKFCWEM